jgi:putative SOS response-associated peptidase YedK
LMQQVHNSKMRMPCILTEDLAFEWLFGHPDENRVVEIASTQYPPSEMAAYPIAKDFTTALNPQEPFEYAELPPLEAV